MIDNEIIKQCEKEDDAEFNKFEILERNMKEYYRGFFEGAKECIKREAIKEFAERLKAKGIVCFCKCGQSFVYTDLFNGEIDNLVNEMVGEENER